MEQNENEEVPTTKIQKIKKNLKDNQKLYAVIAATAVITTIVIQIALRRGSGTFEAEPSFEGMLETMRQKAIKDKISTKDLEAVEDAIYDIQTTLINRINGNRNTLTNYVWQLVTIYGNKVGRPGKPVVNTATGKVYPSETLAAIAAGVSNATMSNHLLGKTDTVMGNIYKFADILEDVA